MLTATYSLVAMSVEQASVRARLNSLQALVRSTFECEPTLSAGQVEHACLAMQRLYAAFNCRKVELFLIPAVRELTHAADHLLAELESLRHRAAQAMMSLFDRVRGFALATREEVARFCATAECFCSALLARLQREEHDLFPVASAVLPCETWFDIAHGMMAAQMDDEVPSQRPAQAAAYCADEWDVPPPAAPVPIILSSYAAGTVS